MILLLRYTSLLIIAGLSGVLFAQNVELADSELSNSEELELTYEELKIKENKVKRFKEARRCLGVIAVPGDISLSSEDVKQLPLELEANEIDLPDASTVELKGEAYTQQGPQKISADHIRYSKNDDIVNASGGVEVFSQSGDKFTAENLELELETFTGQADDVGYVVANRKYLPRLKRNAFASARGQAGKAEFLGHDLIELDDVTYTNCAEGNDDVVIKADNIILDNAAGIGIARNATLKFLGMPIFYFPYVSFPINSERKSGILSPTFGSDSESGGFVGIPYYWNIAPGADATITPRYYSDRGFQLGAEFRYLTEKIEGELDVEHLPDDKLQDKPGDKKDRTAVTFYHQHDITEDITGDIDIQWVSDEDYYDDFSSGLYFDSATYLPREARLNYFGDIFRAEFGVSDYFNVDSSIDEFNRPYKKIPYLTIDGTKRNGPYGLTYELDASATQFDHDGEKVDGGRYYLNPSVSLPLREIYGYVTPKLGLDYASYSLGNVDPGEEDSPDRTAAIASIDSGLFFEREFNWNSRAHVQTLEPRLFYVYIPKKDQVEIPDFDTSELNLNNFSNIFRENRFIGEDRIGDTNQMTAGLTSRLLDGDTGRQRGKFSIGQIYYFSDREITLISDNANITESSSDLLLEARISLYSDWTLYGFTAWDTDDNESNVRRLTIGYGDDDIGENYLNLGYFFTRNEIIENIDSALIENADSESIDVEAGWRINSSWSVYAQDVYSLNDSENRYLSGGVRYDACCWKLTVGGERRFDKLQDERDSFFITLELTGLSSITSSQGIK